MIIDCQYVKPEELDEIMKSIPVGKELTIHYSFFGEINKKCKGKLYNPQKHGNYTCSYYWTDGEYYLYVWLQPIFEGSPANRIHSIEVH